MRIFGFHYSSFLYHVHAFIPEFRSHDSSFKYLVHAFIHVFGSWLRSSSGLSLLCVRPEVVTGFKNIIVMGPFLVVYNIIFMALFLLVYALHAPLISEAFSTLSCASLRSIMCFMHSFTSSGAVAFKYDLAVITGVCWCFCLYQMLLVRDILCDSALQQVLTRPENFDIIVSMNLTGQYLSDALAAQVRISIYWPLGLLRCASTQFFETMRLCTVRFDLSGFAI